MLLIINYQPTNTMTTRKSKQVRFGDLTITEYPIILGDNPSCNGAPITIGWRKFSDFWIALSCVMSPCVFIICFVCISLRLVQITHDFIIVHSGFFDRFVKQNQWERIHATWSCTNTLGCNAVTVERNLLFPSKRDHKCCSMRVTPRSKS